MLFLDNSALNDFLSNHPACEFPIYTEGRLVAGIPFGTDRYVRKELDQKVDSVLSDTDKIELKLRNVSKQNLYSLVIFCCNTRVQHLTQCIPPRLAKTALTRFDNHMRKVVASATGIDFQDQPILIQRRLRLPARLQGGKLRATADVAPASFVAGMLSTLPHMIDSTHFGYSTPGILHHMADVFGPGAFDYGKEEGRFTTFVSNRHLIPLANDFTHNWKLLRQEVYGEDCTEDDIPAGCMLRRSVHSAGADAHQTPNEKPQHTLTKLREDTRHFKLRDLVEPSCRGVKFEDTPQTVKAFLSTDRFSQQFVSAPATTATTIDNGFFTEAWSIFMGTASPVCEPWAPREFKTKNGTDADGNPVYKTHVVDVYGNTVCSANGMGGDHWRQRHDALKNVIRNLCEWAGLSMHMEVLNMFAPVIQQFDLLQTECSERQRQGLIPDMFFPGSNQLADIKCMSCCKSHYPPARFRNATSHDAARVRQGKVHSQYHAKAKKIDSRFNNHSGNSPGPVSLKLSSFGRVRGLVCGAFGEGSPDLHRLCDKIAETAASTKYQDLVALTIKDAKSRASNYVYRAVGIEMMRGTAALKSYRMGMILAGSSSAKAAAARRRWSKQQWEVEQESYFYSHNHGSVVHDRPWGS